MQLPCWKKGTGSETITEVYGKICWKGHGLCVPSSLSTKKKKKTQEGRRAKGRAAWTQDFWEAPRLKGGRNQAAALEFVK